MGTSNSKSESSMEEQVAYNPELELKLNEEEDEAEKRAENNLIKVKDIQVGTAGEIKLIGSKINK